MSAQVYEETKIDAKDLWKRVTAELQVKTNGGSSFSTIFSTSYIESINNNTIVITCLNSYTKSILERKYLPMVQESIDKISKTRPVIELVIRGAEHKPSNEPETAKDLGPLFKADSPEGQPNVQESQKPSQPEPPVRDIPQIQPQNFAKFNLSPKFTFENYLMGNNNQLAFSIATAIAKEPGTRYNPFFLYGGVGLGKTHLMQAIGNRILQEKSNLKVVYTTGEAFTNELIESIQSGRGKGRYTTNDFRDKYRKADVLLVDDIQFIAGREATQEEFFHTFNALYMSQKQIVVTSDRPPRDFKNIEERITSRFGSGIIADIQTPDTEMRTAILRTKRDYNNDPIPNDVIDYIARTITSNVRELEGAYLQVLTLSNALGVAINVDSAAKALGQSIKPTEKKQVNINNILKAVCNYYSIKLADIKGEKRTKEFVVPRQVSMYLIHSLTELPLMTIGEFMGGRDHTTIMHGIKKIENEIGSIEKTRKDIAAIQTILNNE